MKRTISIILMLMLVAAICSVDTDAKTRMTRNKKRAKARTTRVTKTTKGNLTQINADQFMQLVADYNIAPYSFVGKRPAVVDFNATWCGPCRMLEPVLEDLAQHYKGKVDFYSFDIDQDKNIPAAYSIESIPTVIVFSTSGKHETFTGLKFDGDPRTMDNPKINTQIYIDAIEKMISDSK